MPMNRPGFAIHVVLMLGMIASLAAQDGGGAQRERLLMDAGWRFALGNASDPGQDFDYGAERPLAKVATDQGPAIMGTASSQWRSVDLPHDWAVELPFIENVNTSGQMTGYKALGRSFPATSIGWYNRTFVVPASDLGRRLSIEFDGVFRDCQVWCNGHILGRNESGYLPFRFDISACVNYGGSNVLAVRVDASMHEGWFYEGAGIYRHVWLVKTAPVHVLADGVFIASEVHESDALVTVHSHVVNDSDQDQICDLRSEVVDATGASVANSSTAIGPLKAGEQREIVQRIPVHQPQLWSLEAPHLYRLHTTIQRAGASVDHLETAFGIRTILFDPDRGFLLNGKRVQINGTCNHQDHAGVGAAVPDRINVFRIERLKEMGCNAYRCSHNPPTPELLDACDRLGMLVMDENRQPGASDVYLSQLERMVRRDRNHPSVVIWSLANEELIQGSDAGKRILTAMKDRVRSLDPTRPVTAAMNGDWGKGFSDVVDVQGCNYQVIGDMGSFHHNRPQQPIMLSEEASSYATRGIYANGNGRINSYNTDNPPWGLSPERWWSNVHKQPWIAGAFVWTGFDYRGESIPTGWPAISAQFGAVDTCGFPKDAFYYYQAWWTERPVLHLLPHWNWPKQEGQDIRVVCYSNCAEVELLLNDKSQGRKPMPRDGHLEWQVAYHPGDLVAKGFTDGKQVATEDVATTGPAAAIGLTPDRPVIHADGEDVSLVTVAILDAKNRLDPLAGQLVEFTLEGDGRIIGVGNGDPACHEADCIVAKPLSVPVTSWRMKKVDGMDDRPEVQTGYDDGVWPTTQVDTMAINDEHVIYVFRGSVEVPAALVASQHVALDIGQIDDEGVIYLNGQRLGEAKDYNRSFTFDAKAALRPGRNVVAVVVKNVGGTGGIAKGVRFRGDVSANTCSRSVFNGLAQVIVQARRTAGVLTLSAHAQGLPAARATITMEAATPRPAVEAVE